MLMTITRGGRWQRLHSNNKLGELTEKRRSKVVNIKQPKNWLYKMTKSLTLDTKVIFGYLQDLR
jgi:hypothetical protein